MLALKKFLGRCLTGRIFLMTLNILVAFLLISAIRYLVAGGHSQETHHDLIYTWEGLGTILVGFGIALEERHVLQKMSGLQPGEKDAPVARLCHDYGVVFLFSGVVIEIFAWLIKIPNDVLNTAGVEMIVFYLCAFVGVAVLVSQLRFGFLLVRGK